MATEDDHVPLVINLRSMDSRARLVVAPPNNRVPRQVVFPVSSMGGPDQNRPLITAAVLYTTAINEVSGWRRWHTKIYRCESLDEAEALRRYLHWQATALQRANTRLDGASSSPLEPPWAVIPVSVVRGDGKEDALPGGAYTTRLGEPGEAVATRINRQLPDWFRDSTPSPERYLLAISPEGEQLPWDGVRIGNAPNTEYLRDLRTIARGLDELHAFGWIHSDIKPDNISRSPESGFVLIDTDAAVPAMTTKATLRYTPSYAYDRLLAVAKGAIPRYAEIDPRVTIAHDRFGFAVVVLCLLSGRGWVEGTLLDSHDFTSTGRGSCGTGSVTGSGERCIDSRSAVREELRRRWPDSRWHSFIEVLIEPFGGHQPGAPRPVEQPGAWLRGWLERLVGAEREAVRAATGPAGTDVALPHPDDLPYPCAVDVDDVLVRMRRSLPAPRPDRILAIYAVLEEKAQEVAARSALRWTVWGAVFAFVAVTCLVFAVAR